MGEGRKVALKNAWMRRKVTTGANIDRYDGIMILSVLYGSEAWEINAGLRRMVDVFEINCLRPIIGVNMWDRMRNGDIRMGCGMNYN